jgi:serine/threonine protein phosphatase 1
MIYIIGDVHGEYEQLLSLLDKLPQNAHICFVGDLIDRGKCSDKVVDLVIKRDYDCVIGNHEQMMLHAYKNKIDMDLWLQNGGKKTLIRYKYASQKLLNKHLNFFKKLPYFLYYEFENTKPLVVSHSYIHNIWQGVDFKYEKTSLDDMIWSHFSKEDSNKAKELSNNIFNIFGHTVVDDVIATDTYAMIDTGACYKDGKLSAIAYPSLEITSV